MMWMILNFKTALEEDILLYWSNSIGWVNLQGADTFTYDEVMRLHLPIDGVWIPVQP